MIAILFPKGSYWKAGRINKHSFLLETMLDIVIQVIQLISTLDIDIVY